MTFKEKLAKEHPDKIVCDTIMKCPDYYGYETNDESLAACRRYDCDECWNREIPEKDTNKEEKQMGTTRKTKDEIIAELNEARTRIKDLEKALETAKQYEGLQKAADMLGAMRAAFRDAGFSDEEAFKLTLATVESSLGGKH